MIKTLLLFRLLGYSIAHGDSEVGTLRVLEQNGLVTPLKLFISNGTISADEKMSGFSPDDQGRVSSYANGKFLGVKDKKLVLASSLNEIGVVDIGSDTEGDPSLIHFEGNQVFQLCADTSIGYNSTCYGAIDIMVAYVPIL